MRLSIVLSTTVVLAAITGVGFLPLDNGVTFTASPATVSDEAQTAAGYELQRTSRQRVARELRLFGQTQRVTVVNELVRYDRSVDVTGIGTRRAATVLTLASPEIGMAFRSFNPVGRLSNDDLAEQFDDEFERLRVDDRVGDQTVEVLETESIVSQYDGSARVRGIWIPVSVHVAKVEHAGDYVVLFGIYPADADGERERLFTMFRGVEHDGDDS